MGRVIGNVKRQVRFLTFVLPKLRIVAMLLLPVAIISGMVGLFEPTSIRVLAQSKVPASPLLTPPADLRIVSLDSSFHVTWIPSPDPATAWHLVTVWDGNTLQQSKVVGKTAKAAQTNGLMSGHTYKVQVQAMDAQGNLSPGISSTLATDPQNPMRNAAFYENFNTSAGDLASDYFDVRTSEFVNDPDSVDHEKRMVFNNERHFHTQILGGEGHVGVYLRPRVPFDFADRTGTFQFEVDFAPTQHIHGKWFEVHLVKEIPPLHDSFGDGTGDDWPDSVEFSVRESDDPNQNGINLPLITVNIGGQVYSFEGSTPQLTPSNVRVPVVIKLSQTSAGMIVNGTSVVTASGFTLPFTTGHWVVAHRNYYSGRDTDTTPHAVQLVHWETIQFDGPAGSYNPVVKTYIQPDCPGIVHYGHAYIDDCTRHDLYSPMRRTGRQSVTIPLTISENISRARSAKLLLNGSSDVPLNVNINGHVASVPMEAEDSIYSLNTYDFPASWLVQGGNTLIFTYPGGDSAEVSQVEVEVIYDESRILPNPMSMDPMPMLALTNQNFRIDHLQGEPDVYTGTTYLYSLGSGYPVNYTAQVLTTDTPWLTVTPATGVVNSPAFGGGVVPIHFRIDFGLFSTDSDGRIGAIKIDGGNMPLLLGILAVDRGATQRPPFIQNFTNLNTTFNKSAIPFYHGVTACNSSFVDVPDNFWAIEYITFMACNGIASGYADGTFRPNANTSRGQIAKMVVLGEGWAIDTTGGPHFSDVPANSTFYGYIETAYNRGIITGYVDGTFRPSAEVTRGQLSKIITLAQDWQIDTTGGPHFSDVPANSTFYPYVETAFNRGIITGYVDGTFRPGENATRAQISKILFTALNGR